MADDAAPPQGGPRSHRGRSPYGAAGRGAREAGRARGSILARRADRLPPPGEEAGPPYAAADRSRSHRAVRASTAGSSAHPALQPAPYRGINVVRIYRSEYLFVQDNPIPPIDLGYFAAAAKGEADVAVLDANVEALDEAEALRRFEAFAPTLVVVRGVVSLLEHELAVPRRYREAHPHVKIVLSCRGAIDAEAALFAQLPFLDGFARGEIDAFAEDLARSGAPEGIRGMSVPGALSTEVRVVEDLDRFPIPDLDAMPPSWGTGYRFPYYGVESGYFMLTSRGCAYPCTYCMVGGIDGRPFTYRKRDPDNVVEEAELLRDRFGVRDFYVFDEIFTSPHGERVCERLLERGVRARFVCEGKPDLVSAPMLSTLARAGCRAIYYGVESGDDGILRDVHKGTTAPTAAAPSGSPRRPASPRRRTWCSASRASRGGPSRARCASCSRRSRI
ncbi:MAG: radical SAM protein [Sandaracinaceae bacterium]|nr:radical SAM protein [Sandaracinaceae bacterium]